MRKSNEESLIIESAKAKIVITPKNTEIPGETRIALFAISHMVITPKITCPSSKATTNL